MTSQSMTTADTGSGAIRRWWDILSDALDCAIPVVPSIMLVARMACVLSGIANYPNAIHTISTGAAPPIESLSFALNLDGAALPTHFGPLSCLALGADRGRNVMLYIVSGVVVVGAGVGSLWYMRPRNGTVNPLALKPVLEWLIPIGILTALALGVGLIMGGLVG